MKGPIYHAASRFLTGVLPDTHLSRTPVFPGHASWYSALAPSSMMLVKALLTLSLCALFALTFQPSDSRKWVIAAMT